MLMSEKSFRHFQPERVLIPQTERGGEAPEGTQVVIGPDGRVAFSGGADEVRQWVAARRDEGADVQVETGGVLLPGMTDTHYHPGIYGMLDLLHTVDAGEDRSLDSLRRRVRAGVAEKREALRSDEPFVVLNYDSAKLGGFSSVNMDDLDADTPLIVVDRSFHGAKANRKGAELLRRYLERVYPGRDFPGRFRGEEFSEAYVILALELAESFHDVDHIEEGIEHQVDHYLTKGVTGVHDMEVASWHQFMAYLLFHKKWKESGRTQEFPVRQLFLDERVVARLRREADALAQSGLFTDEIRGLLGVKLFADGAFGCETALLSDPYEGHAHKSGIIFSRVKEAESAMRDALRLGIDKVATHAIGDQAIRRAIDFARRWKEMAGKKGVDTRFRFEHFELPLGDSVKQAAEIGAWVSMQSNFLEDVMYRDRLGDRVRLICPHGDVVNEGVPMMLGSDGMPTSMLYVIWWAMHHPDPKQRLDPISAMLAASAAAGSFEGDLRGTLQAGSKTDIVIASPALLAELGDSGRARQYYDESLKPASDRSAVDVRAQVNSLERHIQQVFRQGELVYAARS